MNSKKAKALRKLMRNMTNQQPEGEEPSKPLPDVAYREITSRARYVTVSNNEVNESTESASSQLMSKSEDGKSDLSKNLKRIKISTGQIIVDPESKRALYNHMKREMSRIEKNRK